jgi:fructan beta-fructosidase
MDALIRRPKYHFTPARHWMNDPNGLVFLDGTWHLFFQHNPHGPEWGHMSWGHASSTDLIHWTEHPVAIKHRPGEQIWSGSVVIDRSPTGEQVLVAVHTSRYDVGRQAQSLAFSRDRGLTWHPENDHGPVLDRGTTDFRDPKVFAHTTASGEASWVMVVVEAVDRQILVFRSPDLRSWEHASTLGPYGPEPDGAEVWECPDLFPLALDDDPADVRWVLTWSTNPVGRDADPQGSSMSYVLGRFDGYTFVPDSDVPERLDAGRDFYAGITFDSAPMGRRVMIGWMSNWRYAHDVPTAPWRGAMSLPRELALRTVDGQPRLVQQLPPELAHLDPRAVEPFVCDASLASPLSLPEASHALLDLDWELGTATEVGMRIGAGREPCANVTYDAATATLRVERGGPGAGFHPDFAGTSAVRVPARGGRLRLLVSLDGPLLEVLADDGAASISSLFLPVPGSSTLEVFAEGSARVTVRATTPDSAQWTAPHQLSTTRP